MLRVMIFSNLKSDISQTGHSSECHCEQPKGFYVWVGSHKNKC